MTKPLRCYNCFMGKCDKCTGNMNFNKALKCECPNPIHKERTTNDL